MLSRQSQRVLVVFELFASRPLLAPVWRSTHWFCLFTAFPGRAQCPKMAGSSLVKYAQLDYEDAVCRLKCQMGKALVPNCF